MPKIINERPTSGDIAEWVNSEAEFISHPSDMSVLRYLALSASRYDTPEYKLGEVIRHLSFLESISKHTKLSDRTVRRSLQRLQMQGYVHRPGLSSRSEPDQIFVMWYTEEDRRRMRQGKAPRNPELWLPPSKLGGHGDRSKYSLGGHGDRSMELTPSYISKTIDNNRADALKEQQ